LAKNTNQEEVIAILSKIFKNTYVALIFLFLYAPIAVLIVFSFNSSKLRGSWGGFTLDWYVSLFHNEAIISAIYTTLTIALISAVVATIVGTVAALGISAMRTRTRNVVMNVTYLPVLNPDIVTGVSLLILFNFIGGLTGMQQGYGTLLLAHITFCIPYVILSVLPKLRQVSRSIFEAACDLGCTPARAIVKVVLPDIMPAIITGFLLSLTMSIDDFVISFFTRGATIQTLSTTIYAMTRRGVKPDINALSTLMFLTVLILLIIINIRSSRGQAKPKRAESPIRR